MINQEVSLSVTGVKETAKVLYAYSQQLGDRVIRSSLTQGANYVKRGISDAAPVRTGKLRKGFRVARSRIHNGKRSTDLIGVFIKLSKADDGPFYGRFINDGWVHAQGEKALKGKGGTRRRNALRAERVGRGNKKIPGRFFVQKAFEQRKAAAVQLIFRSAEIGADIVKRKLGMR